MLMYCPATAKKETGDPAVTVSKEVLGPLR